MSKKIMLLGIAVILAAIALSINNIIAFWGGIVGLLIAIIGLFIRDKDTRNWVESNVSTSSLQGGWLYEKEGIIYFCNNNGCKNTQLMEVWGEPDNFLSGMWGDIWKTNNTYCIIDYYDRNGVVEHVTVMNED